MNALDTLVEYFARLPGVGKKTATRFAYYLLKSEQAYSQGLAAAVRDLRENIRACSVCGAYSEDTVCPVCRDARRNRKTICVVEQPQDVPVIEASHEYDGLYHVLGGVLAPLDGVGPEDLNIGSLMQRIRTEEVCELILATNPTIEGDTTALYIKKLAEPLNVTVSRLALGLPVGGDLEYIDRLTLARSLRGRTRF